MISINEIDFKHTILLLSTPALALYGFLNVPLIPQTALWSVLYYFWSGLGITAGYHRYWSHRSYDATRLWQFVMMLAGSSAVEGSIKWWSRGHRVHHRFTDTDKDPYNAKKGFFWSHIGWMLKKQGRLATVDVSDLSKDWIVRFQHKYYPLVALIMAFVVPTTVAGFGWGDWKGGFFFAGVARLVFVHHATFCVNSLAHYIGDYTYDDKHTPKDHFLTALITCGEGYHNFHHEFPGDYRNAIKFYQYDPTKWLIWTASLVGLTYNLKVFPSNEIQKGRIYMQEKEIEQVKRTLDYGVPVEDLDCLSMDEVKAEIARTGKQLLIISGVVYDVTTFMEDHPGGKGFLKASVGRDVTASFNGEVYDHANAARNLMSSMRYARLKKEE
ncbi:hypothetical protein BCR33DRAFT_764103 [Rhizoclosmatium globosum]|uniref:Cytochrome b5 heme-binding domain-containing protein n=1 Tax=Rhizoclosmatium globosum TaxID=329046 RepID=A0A1Y2CMZ0_9FUNG|nr:hypothetical protein BCR33DRAFT_764103 [Rhizoclosmatium globosum]|eukprot:ORY47705.1 hypothetical protein BCR33DRAFT_764103 [Rhizoclosmatium globosum]